MQPATYFTTVPVLVCTLTAILPYLQRRPYAAYRLRCINLEVRTALASGDLQN